MVKGAVDTTMEVVMVMEVMVMVEAVMDTDMKYMRVDSGGGDYSRGGNGDGYCTEICCGSRPESSPLLLLQRESSRSNNGQVTLFYTYGPSVLDIYNLTPTFFNLLIDPLDFVPNFLVSTLTRNNNSLINLYIFYVH
ncbi:hypothetical protein Bca52824_024004 [Brassica carinata]|uniref:Uncharacterized protein n=1 Tax=Brassica carinata TaxID=52824 RepID=A0A8X8AWA7_BRACI|nr:hypothetical protein Bca52824_024004 [Brassica carinata]